MRSGAVRQPAVRWTAERGEVGTACARQPAAGPSAGLWKVKVS